MEVERPVGLVLEGAGAHADDHRMAGRLVDNEVMLLAGDDLLTAPEVGHHRDQVAHRPGGDEQARVLAEEVGRALLERDDGGVVAEYIVTDDRVGHGPAHRLRRMRDGVAAEVDRALGHGRRV